MFCSGRIAGQFILNRSVIPSNKVSTTLFIHGQYCDQNVLFLLSFKLSQAAASIDNRVPTPGSVAELSSQQALPDMSGTEVKSEVKDEEDDSSSGKKQTSVKMEVCT